MFLYIFYKAAFGDFAPYMIANEASLVAVNEELPSPVSMERFRPNVVVTGLEQYGEVSVYYQMFYGRAQCNVMTIQLNFPYCNMTALCVYGRLKM